jgi:hypothetical protein
VPQHVVQLSGPPPADPGHCDLMIYPEPGFAGESSEATEDQPTLTEAGWQDQISSIQIKAGVWDFFTDEQFQGESMRLQPGQYPQLDAQWTKHIGSFQCVQGN